MLRMPSLLCVLAVLVCASAKCPCKEISKVKASCVWHGRPTDSFWQGVKKAAEHAAAQVGIDLSVHLFEKFDEAKMADVVKKEGRKKPTFMVVSLAGKLVADEVKKLDMPVFAINAGYRLAKAANLTFVGQDGQRAGHDVGKKLLEELPDMKKAFFINVEKGNAAMDARSIGLNSALKEAGLGFEEVVVPVDDDEGSRKVLKEKLAGEDPFGIVIGSNLAVKAVLDHLKTVKAKTASITFDSSDAIFDAIKAGDLTAAVDQQPFLQGYLPIVLGALQSRTGLPVPQPIWSTGPALVTEPRSPEQVACIVGDKCVDLKEKMVSVVLHAIDGDSFWNRVQLGAEAAARDMGVKLSFERPPSVKTVVAYLKKQLKERSESSDALVVSPAIKPLEAPVKEAAAKLPAIGANAGGPECPSLGCLTFVGQNETENGRQAGMHLVSQRKCKKPACVLRNAEHRMFARRCEGFSEGSTSAGAAPKSKYVEVGKDEAAQKLKELVEKEQPDCVFLTSTDLLTTWKEAKLASDAAIAVSDMSVEAADAVMKKEVEFLVDQQPFVQGYLPVVLLAVKLQTGLQLLDTWVNSGPAIATQEVASEDHIECLNEGFPVCDAKPLLKEFSLLTDSPIEAMRGAPGLTISPIACGLFASALAGVCLAVGFRRRRSPSVPSVDLNEPVE